jgi:hypothetical protein
VQKDTNTIITHKIEENLNVQDKTNKKLNGGEHVIVHNSLLLKEKYNYCVASVHEIVSLKKKEKKRKEKDKLV